MFLCDIMPTLFALHNSSKIILTSSTFFLFSSSRGTILETITVLLSNFRELARFKMPVDIFSEDLLEDRSFVSTCSKYKFGVSELVLYSLTCQPSLLKGMVLLSQYVCD